MDLLYVTSLLSSFSYVLVNMWLPCLLLWLRLWAGLQYDGWNSHTDANRSGGLP